MIILSDILNGQPAPKLHNYQCSPPGIWGSGTLATVVYKAPYQEHGTTEYWQYIRKNMLSLRYNTNGKNSL